MSSDFLKFNGGRYESMKILGKGAQGKVYLVHDTRDGVNKALKQINDCDADIRREARILLEFNQDSCKHIVKYYDSFDENDFFNIVFEYHRFGDLNQLINDHIIKRIERISSSTILNWSRQLLEALDFIHCRKVIHRDVKPQNILIDSCYNVILADFGMSAHPESMSNSLKGTLNYMSPEIILGQAYDYLIDIWSFGCVVYELCTFEKMFEGNDIVKKITECQVDLNRIQDEPEIEFMITNSIKFKPDERLNAKELLLKTQEKNKNVYSDPSKKIKNYFDEGQQFIENVKYKEALKCFEKSLLYLEEFEADDKIKISNTLDKIGECYLLLLDYDNALKYCNQAHEMRKIFSNNTDNIHLFNSLVSLGDCYFFTDYYKKNFKKALEFYLESHEMIKRINDKNSNNYQTELAKSLGRIGKCYFILKEYVNSLEYNLKCLEIYQKITKNQINKDLAQALNQAGNIYSRFNDPDKGIEYNLKALEMRRRLFGQNDDCIDVARSFYDLGINHYYIDEYEIALKYFLESLEIHKKLYSYQDHPTIAACLINIGACYNKLCDYKKALDFDFKALEMKKRLLKNKDDDLTLRLFKNIAKTYNNLKDEENHSKYKQLADDLEQKLTF